MSSEVLKGENVVKAFEIVKKFANVTPVINSTTFNSMSGINCWFKCENFQKVGAFKFRGACNAINHFVSKNKDLKSVCTHSSGNHAQAVALAAKMFNLKAHIVMPNNALKCKINAVKGYKGNVIFSENNPISRETKCDEVKKKYNSVLVHPSNEPYVILGAGTCFVEFNEQMMKKNIILDAVICPVGGNYFLLHFKFIVGGGLASGTGLAAKYLSKGKCKVYAAEPLAANDAFLSFKNKKLIKNKPGKPKTIADGLLTNLGNNTFDCITKNFDDIFCVTDEQIIAALQIIWERMVFIVLYLLKF